MKIGLKIFWRYCYRIGLTCKLPGLVLTKSDVHEGHFHLLRISKSHAMFKTRHGMTLSNVIDFINEIHKDLGKTFNFGTSYCLTQ